MGCLTVGGGEKQLSQWSLQGSDSCLKPKPQIVVCIDSLGQKEVLTGWGEGESTGCIFSVGLRGTIGGRMQGGAGGLPGGVGVFVSVCPWKLWK